MKPTVLLLLLLCSIATHCAAQNVTITIQDTSDVRVQEAVSFLKRYMGEFGKGGTTPDYTKYWCAADCRRSTLPDNAVYTIAWEVPTYRFSDGPTIFYGRPEGNAVHLKTLFATSDSGQAVVPWAIMNHYVIRENNGLRFESELERHKERYKDVKEGNITFHFPVGTPYDPKRSRAMLAQLRQIEQAWGFSPVEIQYYYASDDVALARMRGMDYNYNMDRTKPSGMSYPAQRTVFCQGLGEGYLHEVLHLYFNTLYEDSPLCHGVIYYLAGSMGQDFHALLLRMKSYLKQHPETDLSQFETLLSKDPRLHIDNVIKGLLCKMLDERDGVAGMKRGLLYKTANELLLREFNVAGAEADIFFRKAIERVN